MYPGLCPALSAGFFVLRSNFQRFQLLKKVPVFRKEDASMRIGAPEGLGDNAL